MGCGAIGDWFDPCPVCGKKTHQTHAEWEACVEIYQERARAKDQGHHR